MEQNPVIRNLLKQDSINLDRMQVQMATAREFLIIIILKDEKESNVFPYLSRIEKIPKDQGFATRRADNQDIKRLLGVYYEQNVTTEKYEDYDGERCEEIIIKLQSKASKKHKANVVRMGIPEDYSIGVSTAIIRSIAKEIEKSNELACKLWKTGYHEARLLAHEFIDHGDKVQVWIGRNAIKELENVTKVADRERLISTNTKTGSRF